MPGGANPSPNSSLFAEQSFLDEVAEAAGKDPKWHFGWNYWIGAKSNPVGGIHYEIDRMKKVVETVAEKIRMG